MCCSHSTSSRPTHNRQVDARDLNEFPELDYFLPPLEKKHFQLQQTPARLWSGPITKKRQKRERFAFIAPAIPPTHIKMLSLASRSPIKGAAPYSPYFSTPGPRDHLLLLFSIIHIEAKPLNHCAPPSEWDWFGAVRKRGRRERERHRH